MSPYRTVTSSVILNDQLIASCMSHRYASKMIPLSLFCMACGLDLSTRYLVLAGCGLVQKTTYLGSLHPMKAMRVRNHE
jgi:hypothetical protein